MVLVVQKRFSEDRDKLTKELVKAGNPFIGYVEVTSLVSKIVSTCSQDVYKLEALGKEQVQEFVKAVFIDKTRSIYRFMIQLNKTKLDFVKSML